MDSLSLEETIWLITNLIFPPFDMKEAKAVASTLIVAELKYPSCKSNSELLFNASEKKRSGLYTSPTLYIPSSAHTTSRNISLPPYNQIKQFAHITSSPKTSANLELLLCFLFAS